MSLLLLTILVYQPKRKWKSVLPNHPFPISYNVQKLHLQNLKCTCSSNFTPFFLQVLIETSPGLLFLNKMYFLEFVGILGFVLIQIFLMFLLCFCGILLFLLNFS